MPRLFCGGPPGVDVPKQRHMSLYPALQYCKSPSPPSYQEDGFFREGALSETCRTTAARVFSSTRWSSVSFTPFLTHFILPPWLLRQGVQTIEFRCTSPASNMSCQQVIALDPKNGYVRLPALPSAVVLLPLSIVIGPWPPPPFLQPNSI